MDSCQESGAGIGVATHNSQQWMNFIHNKIEGKITKC